MKRIAVVILAALALVAVAGCGSNKEQNDYVNQLNKVDAKATAVLTNVGNAPKTKSGTAQHFDAVADKLEPIVAEYKAIKPPDNAKTAHAETIEGWSGVVALFRNIADDFRAAQTPAEFSAVANRLTDISSATPFRQLDDSRAKLKKAGYKVEGDAAAK